MSGASPMSYILDATCCTKVKLKKETMMNKPNSTRVKAPAIKSDLGNSIGANRMTPRPETETETEG